MSWTKTWDYQDARNNSTIGMPALRPWAPKARRNAASGLEDPCIGGVGSHGREAVIQTSPPPPFAPAAEIRAAAFADGWPLPSNSVWCAPHLRRREGTPPPRLRAPSLKDLKT